MSWVVETDDGFDFDLDGFAVDEVCVASGLAIQASRKRTELWITLDQAFALALDGAMHRLEPTDHAKLLPALGLPGRSLERATALRDGRLVVRGPNLLLEASSANRHESWALGVKGGIRLIGGPGPDLAVFRA